MEGDRNRAAGCEWCLKDETKDGNRILQKAKRLYLASYNCWFDGGKTLVQWKENVSSMEGTGRDPHISTSTNLGKGCSPTCALSERVFAVQQSRSYAATPATGNRMLQQNLAGKLMFYFSLQKLSC
jgi:hypothetical protein